MSCTADTHEGGCFCGAVRYRVQGPIALVTHCHCNSCRRSAGAAFVTWLTVERERASWIAGTPKRYASSPGVTREFCGDCGTELAFTNEKAPRTVDLTVASLDCAAGHPADKHIWTANKLPWLRIDDHLPTWPEWSKPA